MYGKGGNLGIVTTATGISLLPETGSNRPLFILAGSLLVCGIATFIVAAVLARKTRQNEAN